MRSEHIHMLIEIGRVIVMVPVEPFLLVWQWSPDNEVGKQVSVARTRGPDYIQLLVRVRLTIHL